jgi:hypothetical protein
MTGRVTTTRRALLGSTLAAAALIRTSLADATGVKDAVKIRFSFENQNFTATLEDNPSARDLAALLPLGDMSITDFASNEKIAYLPRKLTEEGSGRFGNEAPGDLCYYAPWGNLALFHAGYRWSRGLIRLGRLEGDVTPLLVRGTFPLRIERVS